MPRLIAFADRNPADRKAKGINSIALHSTTRPEQTQTQEDCVTHMLKLEADIVINTFNLHSNSDKYFIAWYIIISHF